LAYRFRDIERPSFTLQSGVKYAVFFLLLVFITLDQTGALEFRLSPEEILEMKEKQEEMKRDLLFRFVESPEDEIKPKEDAAYSDVTRMAKSMTNEELEPDNEDPFSKGRSYELKQMNEPSMENSASQPQQEASKESLPPLPPVPLEEPREVEEPEKDTPETDEEQNMDSIGKLPTWAGAPQPYRPPTKDEMKKANESAEEALTKESLFRQQNAKREMEQYDNTGGKAQSSIGFSVDTAGHDLGPYLKHFIQLVRGNWRIPNIARLEAAGVSRIEFKLHQNGDITEAFILSESGFEALDISSLNAIVNTHPAPPLPAHIEEDWIPIKFGFYYNMRPPR